MTWTPSDPSPQNVQAFLTDVRTHMARTHQPFGKACAAVFADRKRAVPVGAVRSVVGAIDDLV